MMALVLVFSIQAHAESYRFSYFGIINITNGYPDSSPYDPFLGETMWFTYAFDNTTLQDRGNYIDIITSMEITVGANTYTANTGNINIINNSSHDQYIVSSYSLTGPSIGGLQPYSFSMVFDDVTRSAFGSSALPTVQPNPSDFITNTQMTLMFDDPIIPSGYLVSRGISIAPEPVSSILFVIGGATLGFRRFRKK